eukprot:1915416-Rhodomonas_salina.1
MATLSQKDKRMYGNKKDETGQLTPYYCLRVSDKMASTRTSRHDATQTRHFWPQTARYARQRVLTREGKTLGDTRSLAVEQVRGGGGFSGELGGGCCAVQAGQG